MSQKTLFTKSALAVAVALISTQAWSAGFQLNEFSSSGLGRAYSGEGAIADDAGNVSRNPALITMFDRPTFSAGAVYIDPDVDITGHSDLTGQSANAKNIAPTAWVPNLHFVAPINDQFGWGASITSNYGLATEFTDNYAAGIYGGKTDLQTINLITACKGFGRSWRRHRLLWRYMWLSDRRSLCDRFVPWQSGSAGERRYTDETGCAGIISVVP